jgi:uncharacterized protein YdeI (YjbR/CyaY-like superfamily)
LKEENVEAMELYNGINAFYPKSQKDWRKWLMKNHQTEKSVWLIMYKKESGTPSVYWSEAVDEALCFGWIDSVRYNRDDDSFYHYFTKRKPKSNWSKINKEKVKRLMDAGLIAPAGLEMIQIAKQSGTWAAMDEVEKLTVPEDFQKKLNAYKVALQNWQSFPPSSKKLILFWIETAKRPETRQKRIEETVELAMKNIRANHYGR